MILLAFAAGCALILLVALPAQIIGRLAHHIATRIWRR